MHNMGETRRRCITNPKLPEFHPKYFGRTRFALVGLSTGEYGSALRGVVLRSVKWFYPAEAQLLN